MNAQMKRSKVAIIGGGSAALLAADQLSMDFDVHIYEKGKALARKFLVAGDGGFNITNSEKCPAILKHYSNTKILQEALKLFDTTDTIQWLKGMGIQTFVGSSGRVFPEKDMKPIHVLNKIMNQLKNKNVKIHYQHEFKGFDPDFDPILMHEDLRINLEADYVIFALGGGSWPVTGSDGKWVDSFKMVGLNLNHFEPSNCGVNIPWSDEFKAVFEGHYLKNLSISIGNKTVLGEVVITSYGLEGNAIYPIIPLLRNELKATNGSVKIKLDLKAQNTHHQLLSKIKGKTINSKKYRSEFNLSPAALAITKQFTPKENYISPERFIEILKAVELPIEGLRPLGEAISSAGGLKFSELNDDLSFKKKSNYYAIGEMLDWDTITGGFLLQACFSTAYFASKSILTKNNK